ncbi:hypothetical protein DAKH74_046730 [Maudiozyma humilis]|uniref:Uncharacterized protein n=1 Tax=Maudiozyma humilis TaxID=51915 RepID=A0AAV5S5F6_MAUHU|nr:hypothetical protein DAKH74_046730 [Kazachstania humilis]
MISHISCVLSESVISSSAEEAELSSTVASSTITIVSSTIAESSEIHVTSTSFVTTWSSCFLPSWFISNSSFLSSTPATNPNTAVSTDLESSKTSSNIGPETQSVVTTNPTEIENTRDSTYGTTTASTGNSDKTTTATALSTTTASVCSKCIEEGTGQGVGDRKSDEAGITVTVDIASTTTNNAAIKATNNVGSIAANKGATDNEYDAATTNTQTSGVSATAKKPNTIGHAASTIPCTGLGKSDTTSPSPVQASAYTATTTLQISTPALFSPVDDNGGAKMGSNMITWAIGLILFI